jgi:hypothetical protein
MSQLDDKSAQRSIADSYGPGTGKLTKPRRSRRTGIIAVLIAILLIVLVLLFFVTRLSATVTLRPVKDWHLNRAIDL